MLNEKTGFQMVRKRVLMYVEDNLWKDFVKKAAAKQVEKTGSPYGAITQAIEEAFRDWIKKDG
jgi:hypothetical protein